MVSFGFFPLFACFFCFLHSLYLRPLSIVGVPKSIDNDIVFFDKTFGHALKQNSESHCVMEIYWLVMSHGTHADMCSIINVYRPWKVIQRERERGIHLKSLFCLIKPLLYMKTLLEKASLHPRELICLQRILWFWCASLSTSQSYTARSRLWFCSGCCIRGDSSSWRLETFALLRITLERFIL